MMSALRPYLGRPRRTRECLKADRQLTTVMESCAGLEPLPAGPVFPQSLVSCLSVPELASRDLDGEARLEGGRLRPLPAAQQLSRDGSPVTQKPMGSLGFEASL